MIIGVTGSLVSGKSSVAKIIADATKGLLLDADKITHSIYEKNFEVIAKITAALGDGVLDSKKSIDRKKLAKIVFSDREKLKLLCSIVHPSVVKEIKERATIAKQKNKNAIIIIDAPLLIEAGLKDFCDEVIVVESSIENILSRVVIKHSFSKEEALKRVRAQMPISEKKKHANFIVENNGSLEELKNKVNKLIKEI